MRPVLIKRWHTRKPCHAETWLAPYQNTGMNDFKLQLALINRGILYLLGCGGDLIGCVRAILCMRSVHLFCETERSAEWSGLCSLKLVTTIPTNSWRPRFTPTKINTCKYIFRNCKRERNTSMWYACNISCDLLHHVICMQRHVTPCDLHAMSCDLHVMSCDPMWSACNVMWPH